MINFNECNLKNEKEKNQNNESSFNNDLSSDKKKKLKIKSRDSKLILESLNNFKLKNYSNQKNDKKAKNKYRNINYKHLSNYSFSNKTSGNELSKKRFETLEKTLLYFNDRENSFLSKDIPIYINHSDYFYCLDSIREQNLNIQIMKYLAQNNLTKNEKNFFLKSKNLHKMKKNKSFKVNNGLKLNLNLDNNTIIEKDYNIIENKNESIDIKEFGKEKYEINDDKIFDSEQTNNTLHNYIEQFEKNKIDDIKNNKNHKKYSIEHINNIDKPKETFYTFRTGKVIDANYNINFKKISQSNFFLSNSSSSQKKKINAKNNKIKKKCWKNLIPNNYNKKGKIKNCSDKIIDINNKNNIKKDNMKTSYKIVSKVVNEQFIDENVKNIKNENNNSFNLSIISLQSMNDSKMFKMAENIIPKDEELEKYKANNLAINKRKDI